MAKKKETVSLASVNQEPPIEAVVEQTPEPELVAQPVEEKPVEPEPEAKNQPKNKSLIKVNEHGYMVAETMEGKYRIAEAMFKAGMVPKGYTTPAQVFAAMEYGAQLGLRPMVALQKIGVVNGSPALWGEMPLSLALEKGLLIWHKTFLIDEEYQEICLKNKNLNATPMGAVAQGTRKGHTEMQERFFTRQMAEKARLTHKDKTPWGQGYDWRMMMWRAQQQLIKDLAPDAVFGIPMAEHDFNVTIDEGGQQLRDVTPGTGEIKKDAGKSMTELLKKEKEKANAAGTAGSTETAEH